MDQNAVIKISIIVPLLYAIAVTTQCPCKKVNDCHTFSFFASVALASVIQYFALT